ncbi:MAG: class I SAM-dependent methyltransferase [Deltaproteobacteria bacterium]|nr:class I SAM-dependent methyltransferase [Deltaproteobacteria bacterium]
MSTSLAPTTAQPPRERHPSVLDRLARHALYSRMQHLQDGEIIFVDTGDRHVFGSRTENLPLSVTIDVHDPRFYRDVAFSGDVGAGESYMSGRWSCSNLTDFIRIIVRNRQVLTTMEKGLAWMATPARKALHYFRRNSKTGSRKNIAAHYDLGNDFFELFLDETLMYSCAIFEREESTLYEASVAKNERICRKLQLSSQDHLLEIGTGWGGFALHAAQRYGCRVTTTTISQEQHRLARQRIAAAGLSDRVTVLREDYRDVKGQYDKLVSIEMIEAVGHQYLDTFFRCCSRLLKPQGMMLLQGITIADQYYEQARRSVDFIKKYIFPGSFLPSVAAICQSLARATDLRLFHLEDQGPHYATTLRHWRERMFANLSQLRALGYPDTFVRMWEYYLCYCEGGFQERVLGDVQMLLVKPLCRRMPIQPSLPLA